MKTQDLWDDLSLKEIEQEIIDRYNLIDQMVGKFYPMILEEEIIMLRQIIIDRVNKKYNFRS